MKTYTKFQAFTVSFGILSTAALAQLPATVANNDTVLTQVTRGGVRIDNLLANDTDLQNDPLTILNVGAPQFGRAVLSPGNVVIYTPGRFFTGEDSFTYRINDRPNGTGNSSIGTVTVRNPFLAGRGTYAARMSGNGGTHDVSGYISANVGPGGDFTASFRFAGTPYRFRGKFDITGNFSGEIARPDQPSIQIALLYAINGKTRQITGTVTSGAEVVQFTAPRNPWTVAMPTPTSGRYTLVLPPPNNAANTPQGNGFAVTTITKNGLVNISGKAGDGRPFTSSSYISPSGATVPVYGILNTVGSIYGDLTISGTGTRGITQPKMVSGDLRWFEAKDLKRLRFPQGFNLSVPTRGSIYIEPPVGSAVLRVSPAVGFNSTFTASAGNLAAARTERSAVGRRPLAGLYEFDFDNSKRLETRFNVVTRNGFFGGVFTNAATKQVHRFNGVFVQSDNKAYGIWSTRARSGKVELTPDPIAAQ